MTFVTFDRKRQHQHAPIRSKRTERTLPNTAIERVDRCRCGMVRVMCMGMHVYGLASPTSTGWHKPKVEAQS